MHTWRHSLVLLLSALTISADAGVVIEVDVSDPTAVVFSATGVPAMVNDSSINMDIGITILDFLTGVGVNSLDISVPGQTLTPAGAMGPFDFAHHGVFFERFDGNDINIYRALSPTIMTFSTVDSAFSGAFTLDMSANAGLLPPIGTTGDLLAGDWQNAVTPVAIGQWSVVGVPEPNESLVILTGMTGLLASRCRKRDKGNPAGS